MLWTHRNFVDELSPVNTGPTLVFTTPYNFNHCYKSIQFPVASSEMQSIAGSLAIRKARSDKRHQTRVRTKLFHNLLEPSARRLPYSSPILVFRKECPSGTPLLGWVITIRRISYLYQESR